MAVPTSDQPHYAGFAPRFLALFVDGLLFSPTYFIHRISLDQTGAIAAEVLIGLFAPLYNILLLGSCGQTVGMMAARIKVFRLDLSPLRWSNSILRYLVNVLLSFIYIYVVVCLMAQAPPEAFNKSLSGILLNLERMDDTFKSFIGFYTVASLVWTLSELLVLLLNEKRRAIHDFMGGTVVVLLNPKGEILPQSEKAPSYIVTKILVGIVIVGWVVAGASFAFFKFYLKGKMGGLLKPPAELRDPGIRKGQGFLTQGMVLAADKIGETMDLAADPATPGVFLGAGQNGLLSFKAGGEVVKTSFFDVGKFYRNLRWVSLSNGVYAMNKGSWTQGASLLDRDGNSLWTFGEKAGIDDMTAGNLGGDPKKEFIVGMNGSGGIQVLDEGGKLLWDRPDKNVWHVETADLNNSGKDMIVHSNAAGKLVVRNETGDVVREFQPAAYPAYFSLVSWPPSGEKFVAAIPEKGKVLFFNLQQGGPVAEFTTGLDLSNGKTKGTWVDWSSGGSRSLALLTNYSPLQAAVLTLFDDSGQIQYQEVFGEPCGALLAVDGATPGTHELWCGCDNRVLRYQKTP